VIEFKACGVNESPHIMILKVQVRFNKRFLRGCEATSSPSAPARKETVSLRRFLLLLSCCVNIIRHFVGINARYGNRRNQQSNRQKLQEFVSPASQAFLLFSELYFFSPEIFHNLL